MAELKEPFASFWAYLRNNFDEARVSQMLNHLHGSLLTELQNPFAVGYTPQYLAYRAVVSSMSHVCNTDIAVAKHPRVSNEPQLDDRPVNIEGLKYLAESGETRGELLLDILEGGRASVNRHKLFTKLNPPKAIASPRTEVPSKKTSHIKGTKNTDVAKSPIIPRGPKGLRNRNTRELSALAVWKGCDVDEIPIPTVINISRHLEPHLSKLQDVWGIWLNIDKERRVMAFRSQEKKTRNEIDDMASDRHRQEFRYIFLSYVQECLEFNRSSDFLEFHHGSYKQETESWRKMSEDVVVGLKEHYVDQGMWR
ncbi:hypothetical protein F4825DRAFT_470482 [Nemania diffusa]|nr:hypothetical protein F4825DRAFT_470482 [Nemania diffusa]